MVDKIKLDDKIFIAGASGMAGSAIYRSLKKKGYGNKIYGGALLTPSRTDLDLTCYESVNNWFKRENPSVVIIAAAKVGGILANSSFPADFILENLKIQTNIIDASWNTKVKRLLFLGSSCIYPKNCPQPISEDNLLSGQLEKTNEPYAIAKIAGIKLCEALSKQHKFDAISLMPTNLYGPGDNYSPENSHVMAAMIRRFSEAKRLGLRSVTCWGSGNPLREFLYVDDLGDAVVFALEKWDPFSSNAPLDNSDNPLLFLNVGAGKDITIKELAFKIAKLYEYKGEINWDLNKPDGTLRKILNTTKINKLGWKCNTSLDDGLSKTIRSFENLNNHW